MTKVSDAGMKIKWIEREKSRVSSANGLRRERERERGMNGTERRAEVWCT